MQEVRKPVAGRAHTAVVLGILGIQIVVGALRVDAVRAAENPNRIRLYLITLLFQWFLFALVLHGLRRHGTPVEDLLGERWQSLRQVVRDAGTAAAFWIVALVVLALLSAAAGVSGTTQGAAFLAPDGGLEIALWIILSISTGICEEAVFRGFLQRQFSAFTGSVPIGIAMSAAIFAAGHAYQGLRLAILIGAYGAMFGILAERRRNLRPGMIAHAWQDSLSGIASGLLRT